MTSLQLPLQEPMAKVREPTTQPMPVRAEPMAVSHARPDPVSEPASPARLRPDPRQGFRFQLFRSCPEPSPVSFRADNKVTDLEKRAMDLEQRVADSADLYAQMVCKLDRVVAKVDAFEGKLPAPDAFVNLETKMKQIESQLQNVLETSAKCRPLVSKTQDAWQTSKTKISGHEKDLQELKNFRDLRQNSPDGLDKKVQELEEQMAYLDTANAERNRQSRFYVDGVQSELEGHLRELWLSHDDVGGRMDRVEQYLARPFCRPMPRSEEPTAAPSGSQSPWSSPGIAEPKTPDASRGRS
eukprot:Skav215894  [mRNA]  locus=scaffold956:228518:231144:- [translate_table: standard]